MARQATATKVHEHANAISSPSRDDFAAMLEASFQTQSPQEGAVITGTVVAIENDFAVIDVGLKTEGRVSLKEFSMPGVPPTIKVGDQVEVYLERVENALGDAVLSRDKARREESWIKLERAFNEQTRVTGVIFGRVKGGFTVDLDGAAKIETHNASITVAFARFNGDMAGLIFTLFTICITVAEVALGLAITILIFRIRRTVIADHLDLLKG